jgi:coniferyl-aldehyde dehydrogenase
MKRTPVPNQHAALAHALQAQRDAFARNPYPTLADRLDRLDRLQRLVTDHGSALARAISADFGHRSTQETQLLELYVVDAALRHAKRHLKGWMATRRVPTALHFLPGHNQLMPQPLGVVGVIAPWNYPVNLALTPVISALAAGNRVMLKPSEVTTRTSALLAKLVAKSFAPDEFTVVVGDVEVAAAFAALRFDHLFFTGSTAVGKRVAQAAAQQLVPVTLELGGKSPAIVDASANMAVTCERLAFGKLMNAGQTCVAPDYVLAPHAMVAPLAQGVAAAMKRLYPTVVRNPDYTSIVTARHLARLQNMLKQVRTQGAEVLQPHTGERVGNTVATQRKLMPTVVINPRMDATLMREEVFGPILPILGVRDLDEALAFVQARERPLALYWFGQHATRRERVLRETHAGGVTINDCIWHLGQERQPFGGLGESGQGSYHGEWGFRTFSKLKPVFTNPSVAATKLFYPPYGAGFDRLLGVLRKLP